MTDNFPLLKAAWQARDSLYQELFGNYSCVSPAEYGPPKLVAGGPGSDPGGSGDPGFVDDALAVLTYAPDPLRRHWTYLTAGLSTPWYQSEPAEVSGFGVEMAIKTPGPAGWAPTVLRTMAFYVFNHAGTLSPGVRIALNGPVSVDVDSDLRNLFVWYTDEAPDAWYQLPSGGFGIFTAIGITDDELAFAESIEEHGTWCIQQLLERTGVGQITDPARHSVMAQPESAPLIESIKAYAANFRDLC